jgi:hypothetical protein
VELGVPEINHNSLDVTYKSTQSVYPMHELTDVQIPIRLWRESSMYHPFRPFQMLLLQPLLALRVFSNFMELRQESFLEDPSRNSRNTGRRGLRGRGCSSRRFLFGFSSLGFGFGGFGSFFLCTEKFCKDGFEGLLDLSDVCPSAV